jgi:hypothetical protein
MTRQIDGLGWIRGGFCLDLAGLLNDLPNARGDD